jgi:hypothetical protein
VATALKALTALSQVHTYYPIPTPEWDLIAPEIVRRAPVDRNTLSEHGRIDSPVADRIMSDDRRSSPDRLVKQ